MKDRPMTTEKKCCGFPDVKMAGKCDQPAVAIAMRMPVCDEHARQAEARGISVQRKKS